MLPLNGTLCFLKKKIKRERKKMIHESIIIYEI